MVSLYSSSLMFIMPLLTTSSEYIKCVLCLSFRNLEKAAREKFGRALGHRVAELKLRSATRSPVSGLIENAVVEVRQALCNREIGKLH